MAVRAIVELVGDLEGWEQQLSDARRIGCIGYWSVTLRPGSAEWPAASDT